MATKTVNDPADKTPRDEQVGIILYHDDGKEARHE